MIDESRTHHVDHAPSGLPVNQPGLYEPFNKAILNHIGTIPQRGAVHTGLNL